MTLCVAHLDYVLLPTSLIIFYPERWQNVDMKDESGIITRNIVLQYFANVNINEKLCAKIMVITNPKPSIQFGRELNYRKKT